MTTTWEGLGFISPADWEEQEFINPTDPITWDDQGDPADRTIGGDLGIIDPAALAIWEEQGDSVSVDEYIADVSSVESISNYCGEYADDYDLDAVSEELKRWLDDRRDQVEAELRDVREEEGSGVVWARLDGESALIEALESHERKAPVGEE